MEEEGALLAGGRMSYSCGGYSVAVLLACLDVSGYLGQLVQTKWVL